MVSNIVETQIPYHFYEVQNAFLSTFKKLVLWSYHMRLSIEVVSFLVGKGVFKTLDDFSFIRLYGFQGKPSLLPFYVSDKLFTIEFCKQYKLWAHFFNKKRKKQFIPLPWRIGEITVKNISHLDELAIQFDNFKLREILKFRALTPVNCSQHTCFPLDMVHLL
jgi:hypothetical protein